MSLRNIFFIFVFLLRYIHAQFYTLPNQWQFQIIQDYNILKHDSAGEISLTTYPLNPLIADKYANIDTSVHLFKYIKNDPALDKIFEKDLITKKNNDFEIKIDPLINFQKGKQTQDTSVSAFTNTRGFIASFKSKNVYIETMLSENQSIFPDYLYRFSNQTQVVPGQGRWKAFKSNGFDYSFSAGIVSIQAGKHFNITLGTGKQKIGSGYRSLLLSDNAFIYPYVKIEQSWLKGKVNYVVNYALLNNLTSASLILQPNTERLFQKKPFVYQYLNIKLWKRTCIGIFQSVVGESPDTRNVWRGDALFFSPVIFSQLLYYGFNQKNHVLAGIDVQQRIHKTFLIYGQFLLDDKQLNFDDNNQYGYQIGLKWIKYIHQWQIFLLSEWNHVNGNTYISPTFDRFSNSSYTHFNQNLGFTPQSGSEWVSLASFKKNRWIFSGQYNHQVKRTVFNDVQYYKILAGYVINPAYNLMINIGIENRLSQKNSNYIYLQLQTSLYNIYYDF